MSDDGKVYTHYIVEDGLFIGEAAEVERLDAKVSLAFVKLYGLPEFAEYGSIETRKLILKSER